MNSNINTHEQSMAEFYKQHAERVAIAKKPESQRELAVTNVSNK